MASRTTLIELSRLTKPMPIRVQRPFSVEPCSLSVMAKTSLSEMLSFMVETPFLIPRGGIEVIESKGRAKVVEAEFSGLKGVRVRFLDSESGLASFTSISESCAAGNGLLLFSLDHPLD